MKRILGTLVMTIMVFGFMACGNTKTPVVEVDSNDSISIDTTDVDTSAVVTRGSTTSEGFGRCLESGCYCKEFKGRGQTCRNCGHAYRRHY